MEICTEEPTATMLARENPIMMMGITRFTAASASGPMNWPTKIPSATVYRLETAMLTMLGRAQRKKSRVGERLANRLVSVSFMYITPFDLCAAIC
ncbi:hypothetical protein [Akkermansia muciniphila]|uniref:hypothetical protein n=1 Tax=Akkermansia muciniphila TaxID=239935 RepID=UPI001F009408|nr:hypothetical protein [Akkermansia muciniphila]